MFDAFVSAYAAAIAYVAVGCISVAISIGGVAVVCVAPTAWLFSRLVSRKRARNARSW